MRERLPPPDELPLHDAAARLLVVRFARPHEVVSWAIVNGGRRRAHAVAWREVQSDELRDVDARALLADALGAARLDGAVGLLTSRALAPFQDTTFAHGDAWARCVATVGLGNALAVGDPPQPARAGTINLLVQLSCALTDEALYEALAIAVEARTAAMIAARLPSPVSGRVATGTGTDCVVVAAPGDGERTPFAGMHTAAGACIGAATETAVARGIAAWKREQEA